MLRPLMRLEIVLHAASWISQGSRSYSKVDTHFNSHFASLAPQNMVLLAREQLRLLSSQRLALPLADFERQDAGGRWQRRSNQHAAPIYKRPRSRVLVSYA